MDFPAISLLTQLGIPPLVIFASWLSWQSFKSDRDIKITFSEHDKRIFELELRRKIEAENAKK